METFTPSSLIAGRIPVVPGHEREAVFHSAAALLDTELLRLVMMVEGDYAWYLAGPAAEFGNAPDASTPLEAALPGMSAHQGNGAYVVPLPGQHKMVVVKTDRSLKTFSGREQQVKRFIELEECEHVYFPTGGTVRWESMRGEQLRHATRLLKLALYAGIGMNALCIAVWLAASMVDTRQQESFELSTAAQKRALIEAAAKLNGGNGGTAVLVEHGLLVSEVMRDPHSRILRFKFEGGRTTWLMHTSPVPEDRLRRFGANVTVTPLADGMVAVEKRGGDETH